MLSDKKAQSALEYMMTYGWAILIIVIVAVILYSMGIFNPSSSVTSTSSGFSPFAVSSVVCNAAGLRIAIIAGGLPDSATSAEITGIYFSSNTGTTAVSSKLYKITPVNLASGHSTTIIVPTIACTSSGTSFSLSTKLQYSYSTPAGNVKCKRYWNNSRKIIFFSNNKLRSFNNNFIISYSFTFSTNGSS
jgi:hypothetical protein